MNHMLITNYQYDRYVERYKKLREQGFTREQAIIKAHEILDEE